MLIADILRDKGAKVQTTTTATALSEAIRILAQLRIGALLVSEDGRTIDGILSERDIVRALANGESDFMSRTVGDLMTREVFCCAPESSVASVMELMDEKQIRHVPVTVNQVLAGLVSIRDIVNARVREADAERQELADYIVGSPLA
ncbi:MAG: CBS domain-containing protein [Granulosicoccus sp.]|nr:CBS domain-containing protein [Granulosicoccus sp.]